MSDRGSVKILDSSSKNGEAIYFYDRHGGSIIRRLVAKALKLCSHEQLKDSGHVAAVLYGVLAKGYVWSDQTLEYVLDNPTCLSINTQNLDNDHLVVEIDCRNQVISFDYGRLSSDCDYHNEVLGGEMSFDEFIEIYGVEVAVGFTDEDLKQKVLANKEQ